MVKKLSVIMSTHREPLAFLKESVNSILSQTFSDFELILIFDGFPQLPTLTWARELQTQDNRIVIEVQPEALGLAQSMNNATAISSGEYLVRMDADDISLPYRLEVQYKLICSEQADIVCGRYGEIDDYGTVLRNISPYRTSEEITSQLLIKNYIHHPTVMMRKDLFRFSGGYRNLRAAQDYDLWLRMVSNGAKVIMTNEKVLLYRTRDASTSQTKRAVQLATITYLRRKHLRRNRRKALHSIEDYESYLTHRQCFDTATNLREARVFVTMMRMRPHSATTFPFATSVKKLVLRLSTPLLREDFMSHIEARSKSLTKRLVRSLQKVPRQ